MREHKYRVWDGEKMHGPVSAWDLHRLFPPLIFLSEEAIGEEQIEELGRQLKESRPGVIMYRGAESPQITPVDTESLTLIEFTGLYDAERNEIYEGDILEGESGWRGVVEWVQGGFKIPPRYNINEHLGRLCGNHVWQQHRPRILGNIYEHNHLLCPTEV